MYYRKTVAAAEKYRVRKVQSPEKKPDSTAAVEKKPRSCCCGLKNVIRSSRKRQRQQQQIPRCGSSGLKNIIPRCRKNEYNKAPAGASAPSDRHPCLSPGAAEPRPRPTHALVRGRCGASRDTSIARLRTKKQHTRTPHSIIRYAFAGTRIRSTAPLACRTRSSCA